MKGMKSSGLRWIGEYPQLWELVALKRYVKVHNGSEILSEASANDQNSVPVYGSGGVFKYTTHTQYEGDAVLFGRKGTLGKPIYATGKMWAVDTMYLLSHDKSLSPRFNYYQLSAFNWEPWITHTAIPSIVASDIVAQKFPFPPLSEQQIIAKFLDCKCADIDNIQEKTKASIEEYKKLKQSIITEAVTKGVRGSRPMKDSGIEWIGLCPKDWTLTKVKWLLNERNERSEDGSEEPLSMSQKYGLIPTKEMDTIPNMASSFVGAKITHVGDLVFNKLKAHLGVFAVSKYEGLVSPDYAVYYKTARADMRYLEYLFKTPQYILEFRKRSSGVGAGLTRLYTGDLFAMYSASPSLEEQQEIAAFLDKKCSEIDSLIASKEKFIAELESYKKSLIYEYVTGKKEVPSNA